jgi:hypothetical protein
MSCYKQGEIVLPPIRESFNLLRGLLIRDYPISDSFLKIFVNIIRPSPLFLLSIFLIDVSGCMHIIPLFKSRTNYIICKVL